MTENLKVFIKQIPDNFPSDKFIEILKKQFENSVSNVNIYKHQHKYKNRLNKVCFLTVDSMETKQRVFEFFSSFDIIDHRGLKHKLKAVDSMYCSSHVKKKNDPLNSTIVEHYKKFLDSLSNGKLVEFRQEEDKYNEGIFDGVDDIKTDQETKNNNKASNFNAQTGKRIIINKSSQERNQDRNLENVETNLRNLEINALGDNASNNENYCNNNFAKGYNINKTNGNYNKTNSYNNNNNYNNRYSNNANNNTYNSNNNNYNNNNGYYNNNYGYYNNNEYNSYTEGYQDNESDYNKKNNRYYKK